MEHFPIRNPYRCCCQIRARRPLCILLHRSLEVLSNHCVNGRNCFSARRPLRRIWLLCQQFVPGAGREKLNRRRRGLLECCRVLHGSVFAALASSRAFSASRRTTTGERPRLAAMPKQAERRMASPATRKGEEKTSSRSRSVRAIALAGCKRATPPEIIHARTAQHIVAAQQRGVRLATWQSSHRRRPRRGASSSGRSRRDRRAPRQVAPWCAARGRSRERAW